MYARLRDGAGERHSHEKKEPVSAGEPDDIFGRNFFPRSLSSSVRFPRLYSERAVPVGLREPSGRVQRGRTLNALRRRGRPAHDREVEMPFWRTEENRGERARPKKARGGGGAGRTGRDSCSGARRGASAAKRALISEVSL